MNTQFNQGDVVTTVIKCASGETITLTLDTSLPRCYSRGFRVHGTKGLYEEETDSVYIEGKYQEEWDWLMIDRMFDCILEGREMEIDVYDAASWMCISALSEKSISLGSMPVEIPDFTGGYWMMR